MKINKGKSWLAAGFLAAAFTLGAGNAQAVLVDLDGSGGAAPIDIGTLDWGPTSFAADGGGTAVLNTAAGTCPAGGCTFNVYTQAILIGTLSPGGTANTPSGLNTNYQITMVVGFTEVVTGISGGGTLATFATVPGSAFLQVYYDTNINADAVSGSGFNDGTLILAANTIGAASGNFQVTSTSPVLLDQSPNGNQYGSTVSPPASTACDPAALTDQCTVTGNGSQGNIPFTGFTTLDTNFFLQQLLFGIQFAQISQGLPFISVDPADCYIDTTATVCDTAHVDGLMSANTVSTGFVPNIGPTNGVFTTAPDFIAQTDFNSPISAATPVPEPASFLLFGFGLLGMGGYLRNRGRKAK